MTGVFIFLATGLLVGYLIHYLLKSSKRADEIHQAEKKVSPPQKIVRTTYSEGRVTTSKQSIQYDLTEKVSSDSTARDYLIPRKDLTDQSHPLCGKKIVFTGDLDTITREDAWAKAWQVGADINTAISAKTDYVIVGRDPGHSKMEKVLTLLAKGASIKVLNEEAFLKLLDNHAP